MCASVRSVQLAPPSVVVKTPPPSPELTAACTRLGVAGSTTILATLNAPTLATPSLIALQVAPPSVVLKKPPPLVPAYMVVGLVGSIAIAATLPPIGP